MRKTAKEILEVNVTNNEIHDWIAIATIAELYDFLRWVKQDSSWALHGRDALNVIIAKENIKLQKDIKKLTKWTIILTCFIAFLTLIQVYPISQQIYRDIKTFLDAPKTESTPNQRTNTNQVQDKKEDAFNKIKILNHK